MGTQPGTRLVRVAIAAGLTMISASCVSREDWNMWRSHSSHFASGTHATFSVKNNKDGSNPKVRRTDIEAARVQDWWGVYTVSVSPGQIFEN
jgi:hypothetical protein